MKVKYVGESFGVLGLRDGKTYECLGEEYGLLRVIDESEEDDGVLYSATNPRPLVGPEPGGRFEIVEDDEQGTLRKAIFREV